MTNKVPSSSNMCFCTTKKKGTHKKGIKINKKCHNHHDIIDLTIQCWLLHYHDFSNFALNRLQMITANSS